MGFGDVIRIRRKRLRLEGIEIRSLMALNYLETGITTHFIKMKGMGWDGGSRGKCPILSKARLEGIEIH